MPCDTPYYVRVKGRLDEVPVPCGKCPVCKDNRVNSWAFRLLNEEKQSTSSYFVTLTYENHTVPITSRGFMTLDKRDFQLFMKRLRKDTGDKLKYYAVGEYGSQRMRPHYHMILFGLSDKEAIFRNWQLGQVDVGQVSGASIRYTLKYINKPGKIPLHRNDDRKKEFSLMSKGLGSNYLTPQMINYHQADVSRNYLTALGGAKVALPKYYRDRIYDDDQKKQQRALIETSQAERMERMYIEYLGLYGDDNEFTFDLYVDSKRMARYNKFHKKAELDQRKDL